MELDSFGHRRHSIRLLHYDYAQAGAYFITLCVQNRVCLLGEIENGAMRLSDAGLMVADEWVRTAALRSNIGLDEWVVMPNHLHGILVITESRCGGVLPYAPTFRSPSQTIGAIVRGFKSAVTKRINEFRQTPCEKLWQRNYHEHIVRDDADLARIREYIRHNPAQWDKDSLHP